MPYPIAALACFALTAAISTTGAAQQSSSDSVATSVTPDSAHVPAPKRLSTGRIAAATVVSTYVGLGSGHVIIGHGRDGRKFLLTQLAALPIMVVGVAIGYSGERSALGKLFIYSGGALYIGSRVWELIDVVGRSSRHNAEARAARKAPQ